MDNVELHENGYELVVNNEKILGHRELVVYYKQGFKFKPPENKLQKYTQREENIRRQKKELILIFDNNKGLLEREYEYICIATTNTFIDLIIHFKDFHMVL